MNNWKFCPQCGTSLVIGAKFCQNCGVSMASQQLSVPGADFPPLYPLYPNYPGYAPIWYQPTITTGGVHSETTCSTPNHEHDFGQAIDPLGRITAR